MAEWSEEDLAKLANLLRLERARWFHLGIPGKSLYHLMELQAGGSTEAVRETETVPTDRYNEVRRRLSFLTDLLSDLLFEALRDRLPAPAYASPITIRFAPSRRASLDEYGQLYIELTHFYEFLLSLYDPIYFVERWIAGEQPIIRHEHKFTVERITQQSPQSITGEAVGTAVRGVLDLLSIGKQIEQIRTININVEKARTELEAKRLELAELQRREAMAAALAPETEDFERKQLRWQIIGLENKIAEEQRKRDDVVMEHALDRLEYLVKASQLVAQLPKELQGELMQQLSQHIKTIYALPFEVIDVASNDSPDSSSEPA